MARRRYRSCICCGWSSVSTYCHRCQHCARGETKWCARAIDALIRWLQRRKGI